LAAEVYERTEGYLATVDAAALGRRILAPWGEKLSLRWIVWHVLEHDVHPGGEMSLTPGAHGVGVLELWKQREARRAMPCLCLA
jgi:uncharacterized damage-inducible protein DinB